MEDKLKQNIQIDQSPQQKFDLYPSIKRMINLVFSIVLLVLIFPVIVLFSILIKLETRGPAFYVQERVGLNGKNFKLYKLRSMTTDAEKNGEELAIVNDPRVTKIGRFIRKTRIDELPQLLNVIKGEMSLIGPRPERPSFTESLCESIPGFEQRLLVKPGLTGWAQVNGGYDITPEEKLELDLYYIENIGIKLDLLIVLRTLKVIFTGEGAR